jgi:hypothetical protein
MDFVGVILAVCVIPPINPDCDAGFDFVVGFGSPDRREITTKVRQHINFTLLETISYQKYAS